MPDPSVILTGLDSWHRGAHSDDTHPVSRPEFEALVARVAALEAAPQPEPEPEPEPPTEPGHGWDPATRPYADDSPWNTPLPADTQPHANSERWMASIEVVSIDTGQYTYPLYVEDISDPVWTIHITGQAKEYDADGEHDLLDSRMYIHLPQDFAPAAGSDAQIIVVDPQSGDEYDIWQVRSIDPVAHTATATNASL